MRFLPLLLITLCIATPALAQENSAERIGQLEEDVLLLKRQLERAKLSGSAATTVADAPAGAPAAGNAQTNVRITNLEEEIRLLRGQIEEKDFNNRRLAEEFEKFKKDAELRMSDLENKANAATAPEITGKPPEVPAKEKADKAEKKPAKKAELSVKEAEEATQAEATAPAEEEKPEAEITPRDEYNAAFKLLSLNQYDAAAKGFAAFTKKHPKNALVGNAYYWQGETHYIRKEFDKASNLFRQGYESMPKGPKAADNLLKLGMSLGALDKTKEACVILSQVSSQYKTTAAGSAAKADAEAKRLKCE